MTIININLDNYNWESKLTSSKAPHHKKNFIDTGGLLSKAMLREAITAEVVNKLFRVGSFSAKRKVDLADGYLFWRHHERSKRYICISIQQGNESIPEFNRLFYGLDDNALAFLLPRFGLIHFERLVNAEIPFFRRCWKIIKEDQPTAKKIVDILRISNQGWDFLQRSLIIMSDKQLRNLLNQNLQQADSVRDSTFFEMGLNLEGDELERIFNFLKDVQSEKLYYAFLAGLQSKLKKSELVSNLIQMSLQQLQGLK